MLKSNVAQDISHINHQVTNNPDGNKSDIDMLFQSPELGNTHNVRSRFDFKQYVNSDNEVEDESPVYRYDTDVRKWNQLYTLILDQINLTYNSLREDSAPSNSFYEHFSLIPPIFTHIHIAFSILPIRNSDNNDKVLKKKIKVYLKKIISVIGKISINSSIYFTPNSDKLDTEAAVSILKCIDLQFSKLIHLLILLFETINIPNENDDHEIAKLPQLVPRFLKNSFNGGSWINPFINENTKPVLPSQYINISRVKGSQSLSSIGVSSPSVYDRKRLSNYSSSSSGLNSKTSFPLNNETLAKLKKRAREVNDKVFSNQGEHLEVLNEPRTKKRDLEINLKAYDEFNSNISILKILENLDLSIFINLISLTSDSVSEYNSNNRRLDSGSSMDKMVADSETNESDTNGARNSSFSEDSVNIDMDNETKEYLIHAFNSISTILMEYFDVKQSLHDIVIKVIMCAQQITLEDPYSFCSMKSNHPTGYFEPTTSVEKLEQILNSDTLFNSLKKKDIETNGMAFLDYTIMLRETCELYADIANLCCVYVQNLIQERESLLNYAARMMKNELIAQLVKNENQVFSWFTNEQENESSFNEISNEVSKQDSFPWFLQLDYENSLIFDSKNRIKGGTISALMEHLANHQFFDSKYCLVLLLTVKSIFNKSCKERKFKSIKSFMLSLIYRYNLQPPEGLGYDEYSIWFEKKLRPTKINIIRIMTIFITRCWSMSYFDESFMRYDKDNIIVKFIEYAIYEKTLGADELMDAYKSIVTYKGKTYYEDIKDKYFDNEDLNYFIDNVQKYRPSKSKSSIKITPIPQPQVTTSIFKLNKKLKLLDIDPYCFACQLTIIDEHLYQKINAFDCLNRVWKDYTNTGPKNISSFISNANKLTNYVSYNIVTHVDVKKRARLIQFFITVAVHCNYMNNFSSMTAIVSALYSSPIFRLTKTWNLVPVECSDNLKKLNVLMNSNKNFLNYREKVKSLRDVVPSIPFFGVFLSDLTFISSGNPDFLNKDSNTINFAKRVKVIEIIQEIIKFKRIPYNLRQVEEVYFFIELNTKKIPHIEKQYELSLIIEPRTENVSLSPSSSKTSSSSDRTSTHHRNSRFLKIGKKK